MSVPVGVGPQVNKFEPVSSDNHQMSVADWSRYSSLMSRGGEGVPDYLIYPVMHVMYLSLPGTEQQMPVKALPFRNFVCGW